MTTIVLYLSKILPIFVLPFGLTLILLVAGLLLRRRTLVWAGFALLWISGTPLVGNALIRSAERWAQRLPAGDAPAVDAIVVLSGGRVTAPGPARISEWDDPDRFFAGVELFQLSKAPVLVFTGGWAPWESNAPLEGDILKRFAATMGVPPDQIITTGQVANTAEEARAVAAILIVPPKPAQRILLITSAFHMPRARARFEAEGFNVSPFPVDFAVSAGTAFGVLDLLPSAGAAARTQTAVRELYGRLYYYAVAPR